MTRHISLRVPWHDNGWNGCVCSYPRENQACLRLKNIYESRDDNFEADCSECELCNMDDARRIPCVREGGTFMSPDEISIIVEHPYTSTTNNKFLTSKHL